MKKYLLSFLLVVIVNLSAQPALKLAANAKQNGKWGILDEKGHWLIQPKYESLGLIYNGIVPAKTKGKWGVINMQGKWLVSPVYKQCYNFFEGLAIVVKSNGPATVEIPEILKYGMIDINGKEIIPLVFDNLSNFEANGLALAQTKVDDESRYGYIGKAGQWIILPAYYEAYPFRCGRAMVSENLMGHYYFINIKGEPAFETPRDMNLQPRGTLASYTQCMAHVWDGHQPVFIDTMGRTVLRPDPAVSAIHDDFSEGRCPVEVGLKNGFIDETGNIIIKPAYDYVGIFNGGMAIAAVDMVEQDGTTEKKGGKYGFINRSGEWVVKPNYIMAYSSSEGFGIVAKDKKYGFIDSTGKVLNSLDYEQVRSFSFGYGGVKVKGKWGFIDARGIAVIPNIYEEIRNFTKVDY